MAGKEALLLLAPWLLNKPVALANGIGAFGFALCREGILAAMGSSAVRSASFMSHGASIGLATGAVTPFITPPLASQLAILFPEDKLLHIINEVIDQAHSDTVVNQLTAGCLCVSLPIGAGAGMIAAVLLGPSHRQRRANGIGRAAALAAAWIVAHWMYGNASHWPKDFDTAMEKLFPWTKTPKKKHPSGWW
uniref:Uncharacterized protein n=1 Tax=Haptolina brevifila TaxID=156173 RepID=A0A7S2H267_9EUKA|mmetsp:Transcript_50422/g.100385  ORF Transcript_50422/g.100385 Transcript_50422/m.100385 type:complete len:192 (+) Transcript_50422:1-576(+)